jgi:AraC family transcriptional regulator
MKVEIVRRPALRVAAVQHVGSYARISEAFARLGRIAGQAGLIGRDASMIAVYHDDPAATPEAQLRSGAGVTVSEHSPLPEGLVEIRIPAGRYATVTHRGPYATLGDTWARLMGEWLPRSGERLADGASYELYRNDPTTTAPEQLLTDLFIPLA